MEGTNNMAITNNSFVLGKDIFPQWFVDNQGSMNIEYDMDDQLNIKSMMFTQDDKVEHAFVGDTIMLLNQKVVIIPKQDAKKYMQN